ncbi:MAG: hypothetical protein RTV72_10040 [Candidatus Thorarchaeota archaeon]
MKRKQLTTMIVALGFLLLFIAATSSVKAFESSTDECGTSGCHDTAGTLTLSSNSTSLDATTGNSFTLVIQAGNGAEFVAVHTGWEDNSQFSVSQNLIEDGSANDTDATSGSISVELTFTPLSPGDLTIRIWTAAGGDLASSLDVAVTVTGASITTNTEPTDTPIDLVGTWRMLMIIVPAATGVILLILGIVAFKRNE